MGKFVSATAPSDRSISGRTGSCVLPGRPPTVRDDTPPMTPPGVCVADMTGRWWLARVTKGVTGYARDLLALRLQGEDVAFFLPLTVYVTRREVRRVLANGERRAYTERTEHWRPAFPGYLFVNLPPDEGVPNPRGKPVEVIRVADSGQRSLHGELTSIAMAAAHDPESLNPRKGYFRGQRVEVRRGPFQGAKGHVEHSVEPGKNRVSLRVSMLGDSVEIEVDAEDVEAID